MRVYVRNYGCSSNLADGEAIAGHLLRADYEIVCHVSEADLVVYNTCGVKLPTENRVVSALKKIPGDKKVIVAGCLPLIDLRRLESEVHFDGIIGPAAAQNIVEVAGRVLKGERVVALGGALDSKPYLASPRKRLNPLVSIVPVSYGCLGSCAYCCVVFARGRLRSCGIDEIVERVRMDVADGVREFWITSQDTGTYGSDIGTNLAQLLGAICRVEGDFAVRVGMMTPNAIEGFVDELVQVFWDKHIFKFVHLPVQSGSNHVLRRMRRMYSTSDFRDLVRCFRASLPDVTLSTDVICGFPGETEDDFAGTLALIEEVKPDVVNVSKFFVRPRTAAEAMAADVVSPAEIKRRTVVVTRLVRKLSHDRNQRWVGWEGDVFVDEFGKVPGSWVGRNSAYKAVVVRSEISLLGKTLRIRVTGALPTHLEGEIVE